MILSKSEYLQKIETLLQDNSSQLISPLDIRISLRDLVDSVHLFTDGNEIVSANFATPDTRTTIAGELALGKLKYAGRSSVDNSAFGYYSLGANYDGEQNTAIGSHSLGCNLHGTYNTAVGFNSIAGNVTGSGNTSIGSMSLQSLRTGSFNIAIGHGAGSHIPTGDSYKLYLGVDPIDYDFSCEDLETSPGAMPLLYGDLQDLRVAVATNTLHDFGVLQTSGDISPSHSGNFNIGNSQRPWKSINELVYFSGEHIGVGTNTPSGQALMTIAGHLVPQEDKIYALGYVNGNERLLWDGYFNDILVSGQAIINDIQCKTITHCLYECKTLHLATSGFCDDTGLGFHNDALCGYLNDEALDGAGFEVHSSGYDYRRDYKFLFRNADPNLTCLEQDNHFSRSRWQSNISIEVTSGNHIGTQRVLSPDNLSLVSQSGCFGAFIKSNNSFSIAPSDLLSSGDGFVNLIYVSGFNLNRIIPTSGQIKDKFLSRNKTKGFELSYNDISPTKPDSFTITSISNNPLNERTAVTILHSGDGVFGVSNKTGSVVPETIFNVQSSGDAVARITSFPNSSRSKIELLASTNTPISGLSISHQKKYAASSYEFGKFSDDGKELSFFVHQSGTTAIGDIRSYSNNSIVDLSLVDGKSVLLISKSGDPTNSGTIAIREQANKPSVSDNFGKIYVKPYVYTDQTQGLFFLDDDNNEHNATPNIRDSLGGTVYGDVNGNTYAGWYTPRTRGLNGSILRNTYFGYGININSASVAQDNVIIGHKSGSGTLNVRENTIIGSHSLTQTYSSSGNIVIGHNNVTYTNELTNGLDPVNNLIIIGNNLYVDDYPDDFTLAIGANGTPLVTGLLKGASRKLSVISSSSEDTRFTVDKYPYDFNVGLITESTRNIVTFGSQDAVNNQQARSMLSMRFKDSLNRSQTLVDYDPSGSPYTSASFSSPAIRRPTVSVSGDIRLLGSIRFADGTDISSSASMKDHFALANSGINRILIGDAYYFGLNYDSVPLATDLGTVNPSQTYVAVDLPNNFGKMSIASLAAYMTSGSAIFGDQCNAVFTNTSNHQYIKTDKNSNSIFIGCDVASSATGWKHGIFIGTNAGKNSTTPNVGLSTDTACVYIGLMAGQDAINTNDIICLGNSAGKNADGSNKSIFIGPSAGQNSTNPDSIGIGAHALQGELSQSEGGSRNIEIVAGLDDNQRLMYTSGILSDKLNIQNTIAADTKYRKVSIGNARLNPLAVLEVARDTRDTWLHEGHTDPNIQRWINNGSGIARVNASGCFITRTNEGASKNHPTEPGSTCDSFFGTHEGFMTEYIYAPASYTSPTSGWMRVRNYETGFATDRLLLVTNRDTTLNIHGPGAVGGAAFVVTMMVNGEHRPVYVSCSGAS